MRMTYLDFVNHFELNYLIQTMNPIEYSKIHLHLVLLVDL